MKKCKGGSKREGARKKWETESRMERWKEGAKEGRNGEREGSGLEELVFHKLRWFLHFFCFFFFLAPHVFIALGMPLETEDKAHRLRWADPVTEGSDR